METLWRPRLIFSFSSFLRFNHFITFHNQRQSQMRGIFVFNGYGHPAIASDIAGDIDSRMIKIGIEIFTLGFEGYGQWLLGTADGENFVSDFEDVTVPLINLGIILPGNAPAPDPRIIS